MVNASETCQEFSLEFALILVIVGRRKDICFHKDFRCLLVPDAPVEWMRDEV